jgi:hypothetical protein
MRFLNPPPRKPGFRLTSTVRAPDGVVNDRRHTQFGLVDDWRIVPEGKTERKRAGHIRGSTQKHVARGRENKKPGWVQLEKPGEGISSCAIYNIGSRGEWREESLRRPTSVATEVFNMIAGETTITTKTEAISKSYIRVLSTPSRNPVVLRDYP